MDELLLNLQNVMNENCMYWLSICSLLLFMCKTKSHEGVFQALPSCILVGFCDICAILYYIISGHIFKKARTDKKVWKGCKKMGNILGLVDVFIPC